MDASPLFPPQYPDADSAGEALLHTVRRDPHEFGAQRARWTLAGLIRVLHWLRLKTVSGMTRLLKRVKIHYKRGRQHVHSPDADYVGKLRDIRARVQQSQADRDAVVVLFQDEVTYYRQPTLASAYEASGHVQPLAELGYRSNLHWRVTATLDIWTGRVIFEQHQRIGLKELVSFYEKVRAAYPQAQVIYIVQDNWPVHFHPDVLAALQPQTFQWAKHTPRHWSLVPRGNARHLNLPIQLLPLPTYASWTNPIEKLWRMLRQEELHLHRLADDWKAIKERVAIFLRRFEQSSQDLLRYVGLSDPDRLYRAILETA